MDHEKKLAQSSIRNRLTAAFFLLIIILGTSATLIMYHALQASLAHEVLDANVISRIQQDFLFVSIALIIASMAFVLLISFILTKKITEPIKHLTEGATRIAAGNMQVKITTKNQDEIGLLAHTFNAMIENLAEVQEGLQKRTVELEEDIKERRRVEEALRESGEQYRLFFQNSPIGIGIASEDYQFLVCNDAMLQMTGYQDTKTGQLNLKNLIEDSREFTRIVEQIKQGEIVHDFELTIKRPDETTLHASLTAAALKLWGKEVILTMLSDVTQRRQAEAALQKSEEQYRQIFENSPLGILHYDSESVITACNENMAAILGGAREKLIGFDMRSSLKNQEVKKAMETSLKGNTDHYEGEYTSIISGESNQIKGDFGPIISKDGTVLGGIAIAEDISERKIAEEAFRMLSSRHNAILAAIPDIIMEVDMHKVYTWANAAGNEFFGADVLGKNVAFYYEGEQNTYSKLKPVFEGEENVLYIESWQRRRDGEKRLLAWWTRVLKDNKGFVTGAISTARDITERHRIEEALRESEEEYRLIFENSPLGILHFDRDSVVTACNDNLLEMLGATKETLIGFNMQSSLVDERMRTAMKKSLAGEIGHFEGEYTSITGGKTLILKADFGPIIAEDGSIMGGISIAEDITQRKQTVAALKQAKLELEQQNKELMELDKMKDGLIRDVSHELKTPVAKQSMQIELLERILEENNMQGKCKKVLNVIEATIKRQEEMIHNILDISRLEAGGRKYHSEPIRLDLLLKDVCNDYKIMIKAHKIKVKMKLKSVIIHSDKDMLFHVFSNLVNNAVKYRRKDIEPSINIMMSATKDQVAIQVQDNGVGLTKQERDMAFDRFYQATAAVDGSGVGLTIAKKIVIDLGGKIWLESSGKNKGTTVVVELPVQVAKTEAVDYKI